MNSQKNIKVGDTAETSKAVTEEDIQSFGKLSGDFNPIHFNDEFAKRTRYGKRIAHGFISASLFSGLFGTRLPGPGCVYAKQSLSFLRPVYIGETALAKITVINVDQQFKRIVFKTEVFVNNKIVTTGEATLVFP